MRTAEAVFLLGLGQFFEGRCFERLVELTKVQPQVHEGDDPHELLARVLDQVLVTHEQARHRRPRQPRQHVAGPGADRLRGGPFGEQGKLGLGHVGNGGIDRDFHIRCRRDRDITRVAHDDNGGAGEVRQEGRLPAPVGLQQVRAHHQIVLGRPAGADQELCTLLTDVRRLELGDLFPHQAFEEKGAAVVAESAAHGLQVDGVLLGHVGVEEGTNPSVARARVGLNPGNAGVGEFFLGKGVLRTRDRGFLFFSHVGSAFGLGYVGDRVQSVPG